MTLENFVRDVVSAAVDNYLAQSGETPQPQAVVLDTGSTAAPKSMPVVSAQEPGVPVPAEASNRHVHLSPEDVEKLFGPGYTLTPKKELSQPGQYAAEERVTLIGPKGVFENVAVLGPPRGHTQVEVSASDARKLGLHPPVALSGDLSSAGDMLIASKDAFLMAEQSLIIAKIHVHMSPEEAAAAGLRDGDFVEVRMNTARPLTFHNVVVRSGPAHKLALHMDFDEANACGYEKGDTATIVGVSGNSGTLPVELSEPEWNSPAVQEPSLVHADFPGSNDLGPGDLLFSVSFLSEVQAKEAVAAGASAVVVNPKTVVSPLAQDLLRKHGIAIKRL